MLQHLPQRRSGGMRKAALDFLAPTHRMQGARRHAPGFTRGAIATVGFNYHDIGLQTGKIVARVLKGEKPGDIPVTFLNTWLK